MKFLLGYSICASLKPLLECTIWQPPMCIVEKNGNLFLNWNMPGVDDTSIPLKHRNKLCKNVLAETDLIIESPIVSILQFINPVLAC